MRPLEFPIVLIKRLNINELPTFVCNYINNSSTKVSLVSESKKFQCTKCPMNFNKYDQLCKHNNYKHKSKQIKCEHCDKVYNFKYIRKRIRTHQTNRKRIYKCEICSSTYYDSDNLREHIKTKHRNPIIKKFSCTVCNFKFMTLHSLKSHMKVHTKEKPYDCKFFNITFTWKQTLKTHENNHLSLKPYKCNYCNKKFTQHANKTSHIRLIHTKEQPYQCNYCHKTFAFSSTRTEQGLQYKAVIPVSGDFYQRFRSIDETRADIYTPAILSI